MTWRAISSDALPGWAALLASMNAARVVSLEAGRAGWAIDPAEAADARADGAGGGVDVDARTTAAAAATAAIPAPIPALPSAAQRPAPTARRR